MGIVFGPDFFEGKMGIVLGIVLTFFGSTGSSAFGANEVLIIADVIIINNRRHNCMVPE